MRENGGNKREEKKPFTKPTLTTYGTIRDLTKVVGNAGSADGGSGFMGKTQLP
jgi:hypothetical protein